MLTEHEERTTQLADAKQKAEAIELKHTTLTTEFEQNMDMLLAREEDLKNARVEAVQLQEALGRMNERLVLLGKQLEEEQYVSESYMRGEKRMGEIAVGLKTTVNESVKDVGGLFQKIGRCFYTCSDESRHSQTDIVFSYSAKERCSCFQQ